MQFEFPEARIVHPIEGAARQRAGGALVTLRPALRASEVERSELHNRLTTLPARSTLLASLAVLVPCVLLVFAGEPGNANIDFRNKSDHAVEIFWIDYNGNKISRGTVQPNGSKELEAERKHVVHTVVFFIFVVCNCGGCLLPIGDPPLFLAVEEICHYTTTVHMTYFFDDTSSRVADPYLRVRVYHDARLAEAATVGR